MTTRRNTKVVAGFLAAMSTFGLLAGQPAGADPSFVESYAAVGSDTTMSVLDAFAGSQPYAPWTKPTPANIYYLPIHSDLASGQKTIASFDAVPQGGGAHAPGCIITKLGGPSFDRPDGSSNGVKALSHAVEGTPWANPTASASCTGTGTNVSGQIDFARSSRGPKNTSTNALTYIPFARDAVSYALLNRGSDNLNALTTAQMTALYSSGTGSIQVGSTTVKACLANTGSGTSDFWVKAIGVTMTQAVNAATAAGCFTAPGLEEHDGNAFYNKANPITGTGQAAVINFSAGNWIAQVNGVAAERSDVARANGVDLGNLDNLGGAGGKPYTGTAPNLKPNSSFFLGGSGTTVGTYGRDVYNVVPTSKISGFTVDPGLKSLFVGSGSAVCAADAEVTIEKFGFLSIPNCGATTKTGSLFS